MPIKLLQKKKVSLRRWFWVSALSSRDPSSQSQRGMTQGNANLLRSYFGVTKFLSCNYFGFSRWNTLGIRQCFWSMDVNNKLALRSVVISGVCELESGFGVLWIKFLRAVTPWSPAPQPSTLAVSLTQQRECRWLLCFPGWLLAPETLHCWVKTGSGRKRRDSCQLSYPLSLLTFRAQLCPSEATWSKWTS